MSEQHVVQEPMSARPTVLMIDDSSFNIALVESLLEPRGYRVVSTRDSRQALKLARQVKPKLILCDLRMPGPDGFAVLGMIKGDKEFSQVPFIFLSATIWNEAERRRGRSHGATRFMSYPIKPERLIAEVEGCLNPEP